MGNEKPPVENGALDDLEPSEAEAAEVIGGHASKAKGGEPPMEETTDVQAGGYRRA